MIPLNYSSSPKFIEVAAAVMTRPDGSFLLGQRSSASFYAGYWEFPGGKLEAGESAHDALVRELHEELGITVVCATPWLTREHVYEHACVRLHFFEVTQWIGPITSQVHTAFSWHTPSPFKLSFDVSPMLPANSPILKALCLPRVMGITYASEISVPAQLEALDAALLRGLRLVQIREQGLGAAEYAYFVSEVLARCHEQGALVLINRDIACAQRCQADGVHLNATQLMHTVSRPDFAWVGASCHTRTELEYAAKLNLDYVLLGSVKATASHPGQQGMGWDGFSAIANNLSLPVFALGGLSEADLSEAKRAGAHGVAGIRNIWTTQ